MNVTTTRQPQTPTSHARGTPGNGMVLFIRRNPVFAFYVLALAISWGGIVLILGPDGMFLTGATMPVVGGVVLTAGPALAAILLTGLIDGRAGLRGLGARLRRWRVGVRWYAVALLVGPLVMSATAFGLTLASPGFYHGFATVGEMVSVVLAGIALGLMAGVSEELGWTGFALPMLRRRHGVLTTGLVMGLLWGVWHFPMFAGSTDPSGTLPAALVVAAFLLAWLPPYRVLMVWVYDRTESLLIAILMHVPISATTFILASVASEERSGIALLTPVLVWGVAFWTIVAVVAWGNGGHRARRHRHSETLRSQTRESATPHGA